MFGDGYNEKKRDVTETLEALYKIMLQNDGDLSKDTVYYYLTKLNVDSSGKTLVKDFFDKWIERFEQVPDIDVFVAPYWRYFCQFKNIRGNSELENPIKMYLNVPYSKIYEVANIIFEFMAKNKMCHMSKIGSNSRCDGIVIRVFSKSEALKLAQFIKSNKTIKEALQKTSPFVFSNSNIGYTLDGSTQTSYNEMVSYYISQYIESCKDTNKKPTFNDFLKYVNSIYEAVFIKGDSKAISKFYSDIANGLSYSEVAETFKQITELIIASLKGNNLKNYYNFVDSFNNLTGEDKKVREPIKNSPNKEKPEPKKAFVNTNPKNNEIDFNSLVRLFNKCILVMVRKKGFQQTYANLSEYLETSSISLITRAENLRSEFKNNMSSSTVKRILGNKNLKDYMEGVLNEVVKVDNNKKGDTLKFKKINHQEDDKILYELLNEGIVAMNLKFGKEIGFNTMLSYIKNSTQTSLTRNFNIRERFLQYLPKETILRLVGGNFENYFNKFVNSENYQRILLELALRQTYSKYNYNQVFVALKNAFNGEYSYFTNDYNLRNNLKVEMNPQVLDNILQEFNYDFDSYLKKVLGNLYVDTDENRKRR